MQKLRKVFASAGIVAVLSTLFVAQAVSAATFNDVPSNSWFAPYVEDLVSKGIVDAGQTSYRPGDSLNRAEATKLLVEACDLSGTTSTNFSDVASGDWFAPYVATAAANMVVEGYADGTFRPANAINRAEFVKMANAACDLPDKSEMDNPFSDVPSNEWYHDHVVTAYWNSVIDGVANTDRFAPANEINRAEAAKVISNTMDPVDRPEDEPNGPVQTGSVSVSKSASGPGTVVGIPLGATGVHVASFDLKAGAQNATVQSLTLKRRDTGDPDDFSRVYLYVGEKSLTNGKSLNSSSNEVIFNALGLQIEAGKTVRVDVVVDIDASAPGSGIHRFVLESAASVEAGGTVSGSFPVSSDQFSTGSVVAGSVEVDRSGTSSYERTTGEVDVEVGGFTVKTDKEDGRFEKITLYNDDDDVLSNLTLWRGSEKVATATKDGRRFTFVLDTPITIAKGDTLAFKVRGDVSGRDGDEAQLYVRYNADVRVVGQTFGYGMAISSDSDFVDEQAGGATSSSTTTVKAGQFTIVFNGPAVTDIANDSRDVVLLNFGVTPDSTVDVERAVVNFDVTGDLDLSELSNPEIVCDGTVLAQENAVGMGDETDADVTFDDDWTLTGGKTVHCQIRVDVDSAVTGTLTATLVDPTTEWTIRDNATNDSITDIVPSGNIAGNAMNVVEASLDVTISTLVPNAQNYVKGTKGAETVAFAFEAGESDDVTVNALTLKGYIDTAGVNYNDAQTSGAGARDVIVKVEIYDSSDESTPLKTGTLNTSGEVTFSSLNWTVPAGQTRTLIAKVDLATTITSTNGFALDMTNVDAEYGTGSSLTVAPPANIAVGVATVYQLVGGQGELTPAVAPSIPAASLVAADQTVFAHAVRFRADNEAFTVKELDVQNVGDETGLTSVTLKYQDSAGNNQEVTRGITVTGGDHIAKFTGLDIHVPKDGTAVVELHAKVSPKASVVNSDDIRLSVIRTKGLGTDSQLEDTDTGLTLEGNDMTTYVAYPTFAFAASSQAKLVPGSADFELAKLVVTAHGSEAVLFSDAATANSIVLEVSGQCTGSPLTSAGHQVTLKRASDNLTVASFTYGADDNLCDGVAATLEFDEPVLISAGSSETFTIHGNTTGFTGDSDSIQLRLLANDAVTSFSIDGETPKANYVESGVLFRGNLSSPVLSK